MTSHRFNTGQDYSFEWAWRYADAMPMWQMIVTQMSQNILILKLNRRVIETRYKASYHLSDMIRGFIV
jgi:hypothetical protein